MPSHKAGATTIRGLHHELDQIIPTVGVGAMVLRDNRVMLGERKGSHGAGSYAWCGGGLEFGESLEEAVARELEQESGLVLTRAELFCVSNIREYDRHYIDFEFIVEATGEPVNREPRKSGPWQWYSLDRLPNPLFRPVEIALRSHRRRRPGQVVYNE
ncbi:NUDIX domain-containing protein [Actinomadura sp. 7K534]|uniref:nucleotide triphosphate diphosphatase NUDT15 n=1 Tax=Actinomadura sp. 7K534 TaxID=2530366 RepID=UPI0010434863|nr:NUDIX domain-containing protein [Actinomadura sp. 7K534]TDB96621.1 NUDIX domain-containing protein [Actinomadura sp. 7K534]